MRKTKYAVSLTEAERARLRTLIGRGEAPARMLTRARILLKANQGDGGAGWSDTAIAGALERKHPDRVYARTLDGVGEAHLVALACSAPPTGRERWTLRLLADELVRLEIVETVSHETVRRTLQQTR